MSHPRPFEDLREAINTHDPEQVRACFSRAYRCEMPMHPSQAFEGNERVAENYRLIFAQVPDLHAEVLRSCTGQDEIWSEWEMHGHTGAGDEVFMRGCVIATADEDGHITWTRFYLDRVTGSTATALDGRAVSGPPHL
jgi:hypothetical protein